MTNWCIGLLGLLVLITSGQDPQTAHPQEKTTDPSHLSSKPSAKPSSPKSPPAESDLAKPPADEQPQKTLAADSPQPQSALRTKAGLGGGVSRLSRQVFLQNQAADNLVFSPLLTLTNFNILLEGTGGTSREQVHTGLFSSMDIQQLQQKLAQLTAGTQSSADRSQSSAYAEVFGVRLVQKEKRLLVARVLDDDKARQLGLREGDFLLQVNDVPLKSLADLSRSCKDNTRELRVVIARTACQATVVEDPRQKRSARLQLAHSLWIRPEASIKGDFLKRVAAQGISDCFPLPPAEPESAINKWVCGKTGLPHLFAPGEFDPMTCVVTVSILRFAGQWAKPFAKTENGPFTTAAGKQVTVPLMKQKGSFRYWETESIQAVELPYARERYAMLLVLPAEGLKWPDLDQADLIDRASEGLQSARSRTLELHVPKFQISCQLDLIPALQGIGITDLFNREVADFSGMLEKSAYINIVKQCVTVDLSPEGTTVAGTQASAIVELSQPVKFFVNRPFLFCLMDQHLNMPIVVGRISNPQAQPSR